MLVGSGYSEKEVVSWPLDKLELLVDAVTRVRSERRVEGVHDLVVAISASLTGKGLKEYIASLGVSDV